MVGTKVLNALSTGMVVALAACSGPPSQSTDAKIFHGGDIISFDGAMPEAVLVQGNRISKTGNLLELLDKAGSAEIIDLGGQTLVPGFVDSHVHVRELGMDAIKADLVGVSSAEDMIERLRAFYPGPKRGQWLIGQGWDEGKFASTGYPDRAVLDEAFPNNPIKLESLHGFAGFYNEKALEIAGITKTTPNPDGGTILRRADGSATGVMLALGQGLINQHVPEPDQADIEKAIVAGLETMAVAGVTSIHEAGMERVDVAAFTALAKRGELPIRVYGMLNGNDKDLMQDWFDRGVMDDPEDFLDIRSIKVFYDGSLGSRTALLAAPYHDKPETKFAAERISQPDMKGLGENAAKHKFQMAVHAIGDQGNEVTLSQYEDVLAKHPDYDHRWRIEHAQVVLPDFFKRQADLGVIASMQPSHAVGDSPWAEDRLGPVRIQYAYAWRTIINHGGELIFNSDLPGEPWTPMKTLYFAVKRKKLESNSEPSWYPEQAVTAREALEAMTLSGAKSAFQEDSLGSIAPGKWADFAVLSANPLTAAPDEIKSIKVNQVWVAGRKIK